MKKIVLDSASNGLSFEFFSDRELVILVNDHSLLQKFLYFWVLNNALVYNPTILLLFKNIDVWNCALGDLVKAFFLSNLFSWGDRLFKTLAVFKLIDKVTLNLDYFWDSLVCMIDSFISNFLKTLCNNWLRCRVLWSCRGRKNCWLLTIMSVLFQYGFLQSELFKLWLVSNRNILYFRI